LNFELNKFEKIRMISNLQQSIFLEKTGRTSDIILTEKRRTLLVTTVTRGNLEPESVRNAETKHRPGLSRCWWQACRVCGGVIERMSNGSFKTNDLFLRLGMLAFNVL